MNIIPNGTEVLIFKYFREWGTDQNDENYILGTIQSSKQSDDLSYHGSPWYEQIYEILGEDGYKYIGNYGRGLIGNCFIRTKEEHIEVLKYKIQRNEEEISKYKEKNDKYFNKIIALENELTQQNQ